MYRIIWQEQNTTSVLKYLLPADGYNSAPNVTPLFLFHWRLEKES